MIFASRQAITFWLRFDQRDSRLSLKLGQSNRKWLTSSTLSLQRRQSSLLFDERNGTLAGILLLNDHGVTMAIKIVKRHPFI